jgi:hypothetical protein
MFSTSTSSVGMAKFMPYSSAPLFMQTPSSLLLMKMFLIIASRLEEMSIPSCSSAANHPGERLIQLDI